MVLGLMVLGLTTLGLTALGLTVGASTSKRYHQVSDNRCRINPMLIANKGQLRMHGVNQRISLENIDQKRTVLC